MQIVAHQLEFACDVVIDAHHIFADIRRLWNRGDILARTEIRFREGACIHLPNGILIDQVGWDRVVREWLTRC